MLAGSEFEYTRGFAPPVVGLPASALGLLALAGTSRGWRVFAGWTSVAVLLWCGAGLLFDVLRAGAVLGLPGLPPVVDLLGLARRGAALLGAVLLAVTVASARAAAGGPAKPAWGVVAAVLAIPYPALKVYWWAGGDIARTHAGSVEAFPVMEVSAFAAAAACGLALVMSWGRVVPRRILTIGAWVAAVALLNLGALAGFGTLADVVGLVDGPFEPSTQGLLVGAVYGSWLGLGICLAHTARGAGFTVAEGASTTR